ncbi:hypothetical protein ACQPW3_11415 [Actinosynnema sp. CA-248983]
MNDNHANPQGQRPAVPAPADLRARYDTGGGSYVTTPIYAFSAEGHPLVLPHGDARLVHPEALEGGKMVYSGVDLPQAPPLTGPFTSAPTGLIAVFADGHEQPVLYYDIHGRAVLMDEDDITCDLILAERTNGLTRVEYRRPGVTEQPHDGA